MPASPSKWLVETEWLADRLDSPDLVVLDGSMHLPTSGRNARAEYTEAHIPDALYFDIDVIADKIEPAAAHAALDGAVRIAGEEDGHRRRLADRRLRQRRALLGGARVVDVPHHGP